MINVQIDQFYRFQRLKTLAVPLTEQNVTSSCVKSESVACRRENQSMCICLWRVGVKWDRVGDLLVLLKHQICHGEILCRAFTFSFVKKQKQQRNSSKLEFSKKKRSIFSFFSL